MKSRLILAISVFASIAFLLSFIQIKVENPLLILERFVKGGGWFELFLIASYGAIVAWFMYDPEKSAKWRQLTWMTFSIVFFSQLILGLFVSDKFLMTGQLHLPIPMMILSGPIYRGEFSVMTILFLSTVLLSGPAWCSHFCYFGAIDGIGSGKRRKNNSLGKLWNLKIPLLLTIIFATIMLRMLKAELMTATWIALGFGTTGLLIILFASRKKGKMVHCLVWCPIGTIVSGVKHINPIRLKIQDTCTSCMACSSYCKYDALKKNDIQNRKPALTCTLCGDCVSSCHAGALQYKLFSLSPKMSRNIYLGITISIHAMTMALAKI